MICCIVEYDNDSKVKGPICSGFPAEPPSDFRVPFLHFKGLVSGDQESPSQELGVIRDYESTLAPFQVSAYQ